MKHIYFILFSAFILLMLSCKKDKVTTSPCTSATVTYDGKTYNTIAIGTQCWMKENLNVGARVNGATGQSNNGVIEKYCYNDNESVCDTYGGLYKWDEAMSYSTTEGIRGICPEGWHIPSITEWSTLSALLGGDSLAGGAMKETGLTHWISPNTGATNSSGFYALPAGDFRPGLNSFFDAGGYAMFWSSSEMSMYSSFYCYIEDNAAKLGQSNVDKTYAFSVRCVQN